ncbi:transcriptional regulator GlxA family with amidase domain [Streptosporangium album]|uniref:Transcriptional regulator GlxA family with amidase domain n=1 Tax=Streptosporangium album TaxID=47479 RepID=A0A7W7S3E2_9ACTN|nr:hypothetical protein [Streptosporangium album]MBB4942962.1 transcriptional regulator GlxA family with amidase domain [Streptosporangium album]
MPRVVFLLIPRVHLLDVAGPAQVFSTAADLGYDHTISYVSEDKDVATVQGLPLRADDTWPALAPEDLVIVPGCSTAVAAPRTTRSRTNWPACTRRRSWCAT